MQKVPRRERFEYNRALFFFFLPYISGLWRPSAFNKQKPVVEGGGGAAKRGMLMLPYKISGPDTSA